MIKWRTVDSINNGLKKEKDYIVGKMNELLIEVVI